MAKGKRRPSSRAVAQALEVLTSWAGAESSDPLALLRARLSQKMPATVDPDRCASCGQHRAEAPTTVPYRCLAGLKVPADCPRCPKCRLILPSREARQALERAFRGLLRSRVRALLDTLWPHTSQRRLERSLGLSQGYLSGLKSDAHTPSPALISALVLLAGSPEERLRELERYWAEPPYE